MATWKTRGLRGSAFESLINSTNEYYRSKGLALVQKIPTPITPLKFDSSRKLITEAYFEKDSTVDYIGVVQEIPVCFDAKECRTDTFSLQNIHDHQFKFMSEFEEQGGVAFILILFTERNDMYYLRFKELREYIERVDRDGHAKNFKYNELDDDYFIKSNGPAIVPYLEGLNTDLAEREEA
ncbi:MAG TPA: Holliday junction resolvase RecU [Lachnospiraceae bacterium]|nr:Holliday junction resolvase RecU [Lachnospiraceae bacterium]